MLRPTRPLQYFPTILNLALASAFPLFGTSYAPRPNGDLYVSLLRYLEYRAREVFFPCLTRIRTSKSNTFPFRHLFSKPLPSGFLLGCYALFIGFILYRFFNLFTRVYKYTTFIIRHKRMARKSGGMEPKGLQEHLYTNCLRFINDIKFSSVIQLFIQLLLGSTCIFDKCIRWLPVNMFAFLLLDLTLLIFIAIYFQIMTYCNRKKIPRFISEL